MTASFHYEVVSSALHDRSRLADFTNAAGSRLGSIGGVGTPAPADVSLPFAVVVATGGSEQHIVDCWEQRQPSHPGEPALVVAHRDDNSLPAALEAVASISQRGGRGRIVMLERLGDVATAVADHAAHLALRRARLGLVGPPSDWLVGSHHEASVVAKRWGPRLVPIDPPIGDGSTEIGTRVELGRRWSDRDTDVIVEQADVDRAAALHGPLAELIEANDLDAISVRCFDFLSTAVTSGCIALAEFNASGMVAGCEGDIPSTLAMMLARELFGMASWMANPSWIDPQLGEIELAHCTVAPNLVEELSLDTHFESGLGVGIAGRFRRQPVTLLRIGGADLEQIWVVDGDIVGTGSSPHLCRTQATVIVSPDRAQELLDRPLGNHLVLIPGSHADRIERWWRLFIDG